MRDRDRGSADVLIVGAGPTGLLLAGDLARRGVACRVVEQSPARAQTTKAITIQARTLEILGQLGIAGEWLALGQQVYGANFHVTGRRGAKRAGHIGMESLQGQTPFPFQLNVPQRDTERLLEAHAARHGVTVQRSVRCLGLTQDEGSTTVTVRLEHLATGEVETVRFPWVVGCDGAHSQVRAALDLPFAGSSYEDVYTLADVRLDWDASRHDGQVFVSPEGTLQCMPLTDGAWRVFADQQRGAGATPTLERFRQLADRRAGGVKLGEVIWMSEFRLQRRVVSNYRAGRVLLVGDAAHVHSAVLNQGMNTGIQDAWNLGWKLALVVQGAARPDLLDSYYPERQAIAEIVLRNSDRATRILTMRNPVALSIFSWFAPLLLNRKALARKIASDGAQLTFSYQGSPIVAQDGRLKGGPAPGDRVPHVEFGNRSLLDLMDGTAHVALLFTGTTTNAADHERLSRTAQRITGRHGSHIDVHVVVPGTQTPAGTPAGSSLGFVLPDPDNTLHARFGAKTERLYLLRPDGYVGYRAEPVNDTRLAGYLDRILV